MIVRQSIARAPGKAAASRGTEWVWGGLGLGTASLSASFAAYMLAFGPASGVPSAADFGLFARMRPSARLADTQVSRLLAAPPQPSAVAGGTVTSASAPVVDFAPTGSVIRKADANLDPAAVPPGPSSEATLRSFILRDVFDGRALVESPSALTLVAKGSVIAGAGKVLSIERRAGRWTVVTTEGIIGGAR